QEKDSWGKPPFLTLRLPRFNSNPANQLAVVCAPTSHQISSQPLVNVVTVFTRAKFMNRTRIILPALAIIVAISAVVGQSPRGRTSSRSATPKPAPSTPVTQPTPTQPAENVSPTLAIINDINISV